MEISSHYYGIYALCIACGIRQDITEKIAYASQFVDDTQAEFDSGTYDNTTYNGSVVILSGKTQVELTQARYLTLVLILSGIIFLG